MEFNTHYLVFNTKKKNRFINITPQVRTVIKESQVKEGLCLVNASIYLLVYEVPKCISKPFFRIVN
jgi:thiamine phosphate synthase YjbQ (UPF0047 family)